MIDTARPPATRRTAPPAGARSRAGLRLERLPPDSAAPPPIDAG